MVFGSHRRLAGLMLWLLLALLPLRGVAHGAMGIAALPAPAAAAAASEAAHAMPCHAGLATDAAGAADPHAASPAGACALCDLCHGVLALPQAAPAVSVMPAAAPCPGWAAAPPARQAGQRLFRPPRA